MKSSTLSDRLGRRPNRGLASHILILALLFCLPESAFSQSNTFRSSWRSVEPAATLEVTDGELRLELEKAIAIALAQNLGLRIQRFDRAMSLFSVDERRSIYDLVGSSSLSTSEETQPSASQLDGADVSQSETQFLSLRLDQLVSSGGTVTLDWRNVRSESNSTFRGVNPSFNVDFDVLFSQPLLNGFGKENTERGIRVASLDASISLENLELAVADTIQTVEDTYWSVVEAREQLKVSQESLALAEQLHRMNKIQVDVGTKAPLELIQSEAGIASRREDIIRNQAAFEDAGDRLRELLNLEDDEHWLAAVIPVTAPETERIEIDLGEALASAAHNRRELETQRLTIEKLEIDARFFRNLKLPSLTLDLRYGYNGLGGDVREIQGGNIFDPNAPVTVVEGGFSDALSQITDFEFEGWSAGVSVRYPIQNRSAKANSRIADLQLERGRLQLGETSLSVRTQVRRSARAVLTAAEQIDSAKASRRLEEKNVEAQQKRYENGLSTSFEVLRIQEDLANARSREVNAITGYRRALTAYYRAIGQLLETKGVHLEDETDTSALTP